MTTLLGTCELNGSVSHTSSDLNECRAFLRRHGLECHPNGWANDDDTVRGLICFAGDGEWYAAYFPAEG